MTKPCSAKGSGSAPATEGQVGQVGREGRRADRASGATQEGGEWVRGDAHSRFLELAREVHVQRWAPVIPKDLPLQQLLCRAYKQLRLHTAASPSKAKNLQRGGKC